MPFLAVWLESSPHSGAFPTSDALPSAFPHAFSGWHFVRQSSCFDGQTVADLSSSAEFGFSSCSRLLGALSLKSRDGLFQLVQLLRQCFSRCCTFLRSFLAQLRTLLFLCLLDCSLVRRFARGELMLSIFLQLFDPRFQSVDLAMHLLRCAAVVLCCSWVQGQREFRFQRPA